MAGQKTDQDYLNGPSGDVVSLATRWDSVAAKTKADNYEVMRQAGEQVAQSAMDIAFTIRENRVKAAEATELAVQGNQVQEDAYNFLKTLTGDDYYNYGKKAKEWLGNEQLLLDSRDMSPNVRKQLKATFASAFSSNGSAFMQEVQKRADETSGRVMSRNYSTARDLILSDKSTDIVQKKQALARNRAACMIDTLDQDTLARYGITSKDQELKAADLVQAGFDTQAAIDKADWDADPLDDAWFGGLKKTYDLTDVQVDAVKKNAVSYQSAKWTEDRTRSEQFLKQIAPSLDAKLLDQSLSEEDVKNSFGDDTTTNFFLDQEKTAYLRNAQACEDYRSLLQAQDIATKKLAESPDYRSFSTADFAGITMKTSSGRSQLSSYISQLNGKPLSNPSPQAAQAHAMYQDVFLGKKDWDNDYLPFVRDAVADGRLPMSWLTQEGLLTKPAGVSSSGTSSGGASTVAKSLSSQVKDRVATMLPNASTDTTRRIEYLVDNAIVNADRIGSLASMTPQQRGEFVGNTIRVLAGDEQMKELEKAISGAMGTPKTFLGINFDPDLYARFRADRYEDISDALAANPETFSFVERNVMDKILGENDDTVVQDGKAVDFSRLNRKVRDLVTEELYPDGKYKDLPDQDKAVVDINAGYILMAKQTKVWAEERFGNDNFDIVWLPDESRYGVLRQGGIGTGHGLLYTFDTGNTRSGRLDTGYQLRIVPDAAMEKTSRQDREGRSVKVLFAPDTDFLQDGTYSRRYRFDTKQTKARKEREEDEKKKQRQSEFENYMNSERQFLRDLPKNYMNGELKFLQNISSWFVDRFKPWH